MIKDYLRNQSTSNNCISPLILRLQFAIYHHKLAWPLLLEAQYPDLSLSLYVNVHFDGAFQIFLML